MILFNVIKEGLWIIFKLVKNHIHDFMAPKQKHLLDFEISISNFEGDLIKFMLVRKLQIFEII